mgnify:FL=1|jgi:hypothetical protein
MVEKKFYSIKLEVLVPATLSFKILAESPQEALDLVSKNITNNQNQPPKFLWNKVKKIQAKVFEAGSILLALTKKF